MTTALVIVAIVADRRIGQRRQKVRLTRGLRAIVAIVAGLAGFQLEVRQSFAERRRIVQFESSGDATSATMPVSAPALPATIATIGGKCWFCGGERHGHRSDCDFFASDD